MDQSFERSPSPKRPPPPPPKASNWPLALLALFGVTVAGLAFYLCVPKGSNSQEAIGALHAQVKGLRAELDAVRRQVVEGDTRCQNLVGDLVHAVVTGKQIAPPPVTLQAGP